MNYWIQIRIIDGLKVRWNSLKSIFKFKGRASSHLEQRLFDYVKETLKLLVNIELTKRSILQAFSKYWMKIQGKININITLVNRASPNSHGEIRSPSNTCRWLKRNSKHWVIKYKPGGVVILLSHWNQLQIMIKFNEWSFSFLYMLKIAWTIIFRLIKMEIFIHVGFRHLMVNMGE